MEFVGRNEKVSRILVTYATRKGSTQEVAEFIATTLEKDGEKVELQPASSVRDPIVDVDLIIIGGSIYWGRWHKEAHRFLKRHRKELTSVPVAVFGIGPTDSSEDKWKSSRSELDRALIKHDWLQPAAVTVFGGVYRNSDLRDWDAIGAWAREVKAVATSPEMPIG